MSICANNESILYKMTGGMPKDVAFVNNLQFNQTANGKTNEELDAEMEVVALQYFPAFATLRR